MSDDRQTRQSPREIHVRFADDDSAIEGWCIAAPGRIDEAIEFLARRLLALGEHGQPADEVELVNDGEHLWCRIDDDGDPEVLDAFLVEVDGQMVHLISDP